MQNAKIQIAVVDGQGGGMGCAIIEKLRQKFNNRVSILALGTNAIATNNMLKAGAHGGASGENAIIFNVAKADLILGPIGIILANAMLGELTAKMAEAIASSPAKKILLPVTTCNVEIVGVQRDVALPALIDQMAQEVEALLKED